MSPARYTRLLSLLGILGGTAYGQVGTAARPADVRPEIRGLVSAFGAGVPISGAEVSLYFLGEEPPTVRLGIGSLTPSETTETNAAGVFIFNPSRLGYYTVAVKKQGYASAQGGAGSITDLTLTAHEPRATPRLFLSQPGSIHGTVVDKQTGNPIGGLSLRVGAVQRRNGRLMHVGPATITNSAGEFEATNLTPGEYVVSILPQILERPRVTSKYSEDEIKAVDQDYKASYWPGGQELDAALPISVGSGARLSVGTLSPATFPYYRVRVHLPPGSCVDGDRIVVTESIGFGSMTVGSAACAPDLLIRGFLPGLHTLFFMSLSPGRQMQSALVPVPIEDENVEVIAAMRPGITLNVTLREAESHNRNQPLFGEARITLNPLNAVPTLELVTPKPVNASGTVQFADVPQGNYLVVVDRLEAGTYVKEMLFEQQAVADNTVSLGGASSQELTVVVDHRAGSIVGSVLANDQPLRNPHVILARWPLPGSAYYIPQRANGDDIGRFSFTGLAPGAYRVLALRSRQEFDNRRPGAFERALRTAQTIEVPPNGTPSVRVAVGSLQ